MFNIGFSELVILGIIALIFIGPKELPEIARVLGRFLNELKRTTSDLTGTMMQPTEEIRKNLSEMRKTLEEPISEDGDPGLQSEEKTDGEKGPT